jgi:hypothetical protein
LNNFPGIISPDPLIRGGKGEEEKGKERGQGRRGEDG